jgi:alpha-methylacyl-CoA racemase
MCAMLLADLGADVLRVDRVADADLGIRVESRYALLNRGRRSIAIDLKRAPGRDLLLRLAERSDALIEGFRPGVAERLGIGPADCLARNPRLVYGRMTGWGQDGPLAHAAGHDTNYIALAGALHAMGDPKEPPRPPLNLVGDFGGGGLYLAVGLLAGLLEARTSGKGQVVDAAMIDGAAHLMTAFFGMFAAGEWSLERGTNLLDGSAPFIGTYETKDGRYVSVCALERRFYEELVRRLGLDPAALPDRFDRARWPELRERFAAIFRERTRDEWCGLLEGTDACFAPVLDLGEVSHHPHHRARGTFVELDGVVQPAPAPRFDRTPGRIPRPPSLRGEHSREVLRELGLGEAEIASLLAERVVAEAAVPAPSAERR